MYERTTGPATWRKIVRFNVGADETRMTESQVRAPMMRHVLVRLGVALYRARAQLSGRLALGAVKEDGADDQRGAEDEEVRHLSAPGV